MIKGSWKTTAAGAGAVLISVGTIIGSLAEGAVEAIDWGAIIASLIAGLGLMFARDNNKSSEDVGAKK